MDVTQIGIKINQTNQSNKEKLNSTTQTEAPVMSFDQILAMFNHLGQSTQSEGKSATSSLHNVSGMTDSKQTDPTKLSAEDWSNLDSILTAWAAAIQQINNSPATQELIPKKLSSASELSIPPAVSNMLCPLQQVNAEGSEALSQWVQKVDGLYQSSTMEPNKLLQGLSQLIGELRSQDQQKSFDVPNDIGDKIRIIMNELKTENKMGVIKSFNTPFYKNKWLLNDKKQVENLVSKQTGGPTEASSLQNVSEMTDRDQIDSPVLSTEDLENLDSILTVWAGAIKHINNSPATQKFMPEKLSSESDLSNPPVVSNLFSQHQQVNAEGSEALSQWLQKVDGLYQTSTMDPIKLLQELPQLIGELQSQDKQKSLDVPNDIGDKIQIIINELKTENKLGIITTINSLSNKNGLLFDNKQRDLSLESKIGLNLDKNQAMFSAIPDLGKRIGDGGSLAQAAYSPQVEDQTKSSGMPIMGNHQLQGSNGWNGSNVESLPTNLTVSEFAPEVSEWIGRYMKINNGAFGSTEAKFSLYPEHLGPIEIKITSQHGQVAAQIITDTSMAKDALEGQLQQLRQALQQQGLIVQKLDVIQQTPVSMDMNQANLSFSQGGSGSFQQQRTFALEKDETNRREEANQKEIEKETISYGGATTIKASRIDFTA